MTIKLIGAALPFFSLFMALVTADSLYRRPGKKTLRMAIQKAEFRQCVVLAAVLAPLGIFADRPIPLGALVLSNTIAHFIFLAKLKAAYGSK